MIFTVLKKDLFLVMGICCVSVWECGCVHVTERRCLLKPEALGPLKEANLCILKGSECPAEPSLQPLSFVLFLSLFLFDDSNERRAP